MNTLREPAVAILGTSAEALAKREFIDSGRDETTIAVIAKARPLIVELRDRYAAGAPAPLHKTAAEEMRHLCEQLEKLGDASGSERAQRALHFEAGRINQFIMTHGAAVGANGFEFKDQL